MEISSMIEGPCKFRERVRALTTPKLAHRDPKPVAGDTAVVIGSGRGFYVCIFDNDPSRRMVLCSPDELERTPT